MEKNYKIIKLSQTRRMVIVLTYDLTLQEMSEINRRVGNHSGLTLYFDYLLSNGLSNRFFSIAATSLKSNKSLRLCNHIPAKYEEISNDFFRKNYRFIEYSVLSSSQRKLFKR